MKYKHIILGLSLLLVGTTFSQKTYTIKEGDEYKVDLNTKSRNYFYRGGDIYLYKNDHKKVEVQKFDGKTGKLLVSNEEDRLEKNEAPLGVISLKNKDYLFSLTVGRTGNNAKVIANEFDYENVKIGKEYTLIEESEKILSNFSTSIYNSSVMSEVRAPFSKGIGQQSYASSVKLIASLDSTKVALHYIKSAGSRKDNKENTTFTWVQFDENMNKLWEKDVEYPYPAKQIITYNYLVANNGDIYFITRVNAEGRALFSKKDYDIQIFKIDAKTQEVSNQSIEPPYRLINTYALTENLQGQVYFIGGYDELYEEGNKNKSTFEGFFTAEINPDFTITNYKKLEIPVSTRIQYIGKKAHNRLVKRGNMNTYRLGGYAIKDIDFNKDGSFVILAESDRVVVKVDSESGRESIFFHSTHIVGLGADAEGNVLWTKKIPKYQVSSNYYGGTGYFYTSDEDYAYLIYGDNIKNLTLTPDKAMGKKDRYWNGVPKKSVLMLRKIDKRTGQMTSEDMLVLKNVDSRNSNRKFGIHRFVSLDGGDFVFDASLKSKVGKMFKFEAQ